MTRRQLAVVVAVSAMVLSVNLNAGQPVRVVGRPSDNRIETVEQHHYSMTARVRPLVVFWITRSGVGDAVVTWRRGPREVGYSLLIGSDPDRAPRRINRWGYIDEEIRGAEARLIGLMTQSEENTVEEAEASVRKPVTGERSFKIIQATIDHDQARSVVGSIDAPGTYTFRDARIVLDLATRGTIEGRSRVVRLPTGTRPGFLSALADLIHAQVERSRTPDGLRAGGSMPFVYHGRIYELRSARARQLSVAAVGGKFYHHVVVTDLEIKNTDDGEVSRFSMTVGTEGPLAEVPIGLSYQPRWWMQIDLALDDETGGHAMVEE